MSLIRRHRRKRGRREYTAWVVKAAGTTLVAERRVVERRDAVILAVVKRVAHACAPSGVEAVNVVDVEACEP